jgi:hypothetical protein
MSRDEIDVDPEWLERRSGVDSPLRGGQDPEAHHGSSVAQEAD